MKMLYFTIHSDEQAKEQCTKMGLHLSDKPKTKKSPIIGLDYEYDILTNNGVRVGSYNVYVHSHLYPGLKDCLYIDKQLYLTNRLLS